MIKKALYALAIVLFSHLYALGEDIPLTIQDLQGGEVNQLDSLLIPDNAVSEARNVWFDDTSMVKKRKGMSKLNTSAIGNSGTIYNQFEFRKSNGTDYHIVVASNTLYYRTGGATFSAFQANMSTTTSITNFEVFMDTLQFCNGVANLQYWDTSKVATTTSSYQPKYMLAWQNRLWIAGDTDEPTSLRSSKYLDPFTWTIPTSNAVATDPVLFDINSQDGQDITGIVKSPNGDLLILKQRSAWELSGTDRDDFSIRLVSPDIGCLDSGSYAFREGKAMWLSSQGYVEYDGNRISIVSRPIQATVDNIQQLKSAQGTFIKNTSDQWAVFNSTSFADITTSPGTLQNQFSLDNNANAANAPVNGGSIVKFDDITINALQTKGFSFDNNRFVDGKLFNQHVIKFLGDASYTGQPRINPGKLVLDSNKKAHTVFYYNNAGSWEVWYASSTNTLSWFSTKIANLGEQASLTWGNLPHGLSVAVDSNNNPHVIFSQEKTGDSSIHNIRYYYYSGGWNNGGLLGGSTINYYDFTLVINSNNHLNIVGSKSFQLFSIDASSGASSSWNETNTSLDQTSSNAVIDTSNNLYIGVATGLATNRSGSWVTSAFALPYITKLFMDRNNTVRFLTTTGDVSGQNTIWASYYGEYYPTSGLFSSTHTVISPSEGVTHYPDMDMFVGSDGYPIAAAFTDTTISPNHSRIFTSTGTYISEIWDTGYNSNVTLDTFRTQEMDHDYNVYHYLRSSSTSAGIATTSWTQVTKNAIPSLSAYRFIQYKVEMSTNILSNNVPTIDEVDIPYHSTFSSAKLSSMFYNHRIYNAVSISSSTVLDRTIIYDKNNAWTEHTSGINCTNVYNFNGTPYFGSDTGFVYQMDIGNDDDGSPISAYFLTKTYAVGANYMKNLSKLFLLANASGNWNLNLQYFLDKNSTAKESFPISLNQTSGVINYKIPLKKNDPWGLIQFKIYNSNVNEPFDLYGIYGYYRLQPLR